MKIAIAIWNDNVSSAFDFSAHILVVEIENDKELSRSQILLESQSPLQRVNQLKSLEVDSLICGAISRTLSEMITAADIQVLAYITGRIDDVIEAYVTGQLEQSQFSMPGCWPGARKGLGQCGQVRGRCRRQANQKTLSYKKGIGMKIIVTSQGKELSSEIDLRFGRAKWLIVFDTETKDFQVHDNEINLNAAQGAGIQTGLKISNLCADIVITGNVGPKAFKTLSVAKIKVFLTEKQTVQQAIDSYSSGKLKSVDQANVEGHWV